MHTFGQLRLGFSPPQSPFSFIDTCRSCCLSLKKLLGSAIYPAYLLVLLSQAAHHISRNDEDLPQNPRNPQNPQPSSEGLDLVGPCLARVVNDDESEESSLFTFLGQSLPRIAVSSSSSDETGWVGQAGVSEHFAILANPASNTRAGGCRRRTGMRLMRAFREDW